jgi:Cof subfamily protein (haloacid dehalogenase superfamily)
MAGTIKALFLDIDGTLISGGTGPFQDDIEQIEKARRRGHKVFLNTGRSLAFIPRMIREASFFDGIVAGGGAHVLLGGETIYHKWIPQDLLSEVAALYLKNGKWCLLEGEAENLIINEKDGPYPRVLHRDDFSGKYAGILITKLTMDKRFAPEEQAFLEKHFHIYDLGIHAEGIIRGESKAAGMEIVLKALGISRRNSIAIGDSENDITMIRHAGIGIAMGNACAALKAAAAEITAPCGQGGIARAIERHLS